MENRLPLVSIVIPVYGVERYIERCARSVFEQTYENLEIIFVDDCSPDRSIDVLKRVVVNYPQRKGQTKIIRHKTNRGPAAARNTAISNATGKYIIFADSDDWMEMDEVAQMEQAIEERALDVVYSDYYENYPDKQIQISQDCGEDNIACIKSMLTGKMHGSLCNKIYRMSALQESGIREIEGANMYEDICLNLRFFAFSKKIGYLNKAFYHYTQNVSNSITHDIVNIDKKRKTALQKIHNATIASGYLTEKGLAHVVSHEMNEWKLLIKNELLQDNSQYSLLRWIVTFPEADSAIWYAPSMSFNYRLLLMWLHLRWLWAYKSHVRLLGILGKR